MVVGWAVAVAGFAVAGIAVAGIAVDGPPVAGPAADGVALGAARAGVCGRAAGLVAPAGGTALDEAAGAGVAASRAWPIGALST